MFQREQHPLDAQKWHFTPEGQHIELGIAEMNLFLLLGAAGLGHSLFGERLLPIGTLYDPFISRGLDALNYACYQDARFMLVATPSGVSLAPEGGAHQSIATPLIGMARTAWPPSSRPSPTNSPSSWTGPSTTCSATARAIRDERTWLRDETGGSVYLRLSTARSSSPARAPTTTFAQGIIDGAYWLRKPGPELRGGASPTRASSRPRRSRAAGVIGGDRRNVGVLAVTSADRLNAGWHAAQRARRAGNASHAATSRRCSPTCRATARMVTVIDGHPATLGLAGRRRRPPHHPARRRTFRPDRHDRRSLPPLRHRPQLDRPTGTRRPAHGP